MKGHHLKTWPVYYKPVKLDLKRVEIRKDDRAYEVGDLLFLEEFIPEEQQYTGDITTRIVTHTLRGLPFVPEGYVVMSIKPL